MQRSPAENLLTQRSPAGLTCHHSVPLRSSLGNAAPPCEDFDNAEPILRDTVVDAEPILQDTVDNAEPILRDTVVDAEPILRDTVDNAEPILRGALLTQGLGCEELGNAAVSCRELGNAAVSCRELVNAAVSCGSHLSSQRPPAEFTW
ncbi:unnamed protein product [Penicillium nalgiovense]|nr:unnamed protein product [Penicillium nalgiovense]